LPAIPMHFGEANVKRHESTRSDVLGRIQRPALPKDLTRGRVGSGFVVRERNENHEKGDDAVKQKKQRNRKAANYSWLERVEGLWEKVGKANSQKSLRRGEKRGAQLYNEKDRRGKGWEQNWAASIIFEGLATVLGERGQKKKEAELERHGGGGGSRKI